MGVVVFVMPLDVAVGDADLVPPQLPCCPLRVCYQDVGREVVVDDDPKPWDFIAAAARRSQFTANVSRKSNIVPARSTYCRLIFVASGRSAPSMISVYS